MIRDGLLDALDGVRRSNIHGNGLVVREPDEDLEGGGSSVPWCFERFFSGL